MRSTQVSFGHAKPAGSRGRDLRDHRLDTFDATSGGSEGIQGLHNLTVTCSYVQPRNRPTPTPYIAKHPRKYAAVFGDVVPAATANNADLSRTNLVKSAANAQIDRGSAGPRIYENERARPTSHCAISGFLGPHRVGLMSAIRAVDSVQGSHTCDRPNRRHPWLQGDTFGTSVL